MQRAADSVVAGLPDHCGRFCRRLPVRMDRVSRAAMHVLGTCTRIRDTAARRAHAALSWRDVPRVSKAYPPLLPLSVEIVNDPAIDRPANFPNSFVSDHVAQLVQTRNDVDQ